MFHSYGNVTKDQRRAATIIIMIREYDDTV